MAPRTALVTGATGYIGSYLVTALTESGWEVRAAGRRPRPESLAPEVDYVTADLADDDLTALVDGVTHVFHLAGASSSRSDDEEMQRTNVEGTGRLVEAAERRGVDR